MDVAIAGGHGQIALHLTRLLTERGDTVQSLIRNADHTADVEEAGGHAVICDMEAEDSLAPFVEGADAVVFAAGAGAGSGEERKRTVDYGAAVKLLDAGVKRYLIVSSIGADDPSQADDKMKAYQQAKHDADEAVAESDLDWTIVRPGTLTDSGPTGKVSAGPDVGYAEIPRADVALVLAACLADPNSIGKTFNLVSGDEPIARAVAAL